ncbi:MAG: hypothetical protein QOE82_1513 [Thermoanaerobaculia bacterium]|jgi:hypothetical protein|nr:hypothetical protein [Thermoanaerobaculia bacterium]
MIAVDTNVLIYACDQSEPRRQTIALDLIAASTQGVLLWQVACEFLAASRKLRGGEEIRRPVVMPNQCGLRCMRSSRHISPKLWSAVATEPPLWEGGTSRRRSKHHTLGVVTFHRPPQAVALPPHSKVLRTKGLQKSSELLRPGMIPRGA